MKNIVILATGGTIAGAGEQGKNIGYKSGSIEAQTLIDAIPELKNVANIRVEQVCNINSDDITSEIWITLAKRVKTLSQCDDVDGFVLMHGTDTMEETAFFLSLTLGANIAGDKVSGDCVAKPVVLTGSMRPATSTEPDGPANLLFAVKSAVSLSSRPDFSSSNLSSSAPVILEGRRPDRNAIESSAVYVAFAGKLMDARFVQKVHANNLDAFSSFSTDREGSHQASSHVCNGLFDISSLRELPRVTVLYFNADADVEQVRFAAEFPLLCRRESIAAPLCRSSCLCRERLLLTICLRRRRPCCYVWR